jgi:uncharacterized SAM-binding protein YcdF (DUF218 family)
VRLFKQLLGFGLLAIAIVYIVAFGSVYTVSREDQARESYAIVVLGAAQYNGKPSPVLQSRLDHARLLYGKLLAPTIVLTGGVAKGDQISEAQAAADYLIRKKVPETVLVVLAEGSTTEQSVIAAADWCKARGIREVVVVSDPFHMLRVRLEMRRRGITAWTSPTRTSPISARRTREIPYLMAEALKVVVAGGRGW